MRAASRMTSRSRSTRRSSRASHSGIRSSASKPRPPLLAWRPGSPPTNPRPGIARRSGRCITPAPTPPIRRARPWGRIQRAQEAQVQDQAWVHYATQAYQQSIPLDPRDKDARGAIDTVFTTATKGLTPGSAEWINRGARHRAPHGRDAGLDGRVVARAAGERGSLHRGRGRADGGAAARGEPRAARRTRSMTRTRRSRGSSTMR